MPVLDLKRYTTISVCVALVAFIYSCNIFFTLPFAQFPGLQRWIFSSTSDDNSPSKVPPCEPIEFQIPTPTPDKSPSIPQPTPRKPGGSLSTLVNFLQKEKICVMV
jgi:hypothetical protein